MKRLVDGLIKALIKAYPEVVLTQFATIKRDMLVGFISERANEVAITLTMKILDQEGINHCRYCPRRFSLRKQDGFFVCLAHVKKETSQNGKPH